MPHLLNEHNLFIENVVIQDGAFMMTKTIVSRQVNLLTNALKQLAPNDNAFISDANLIILSHYGFVVRQKNNGWLITDLGSTYLVIANTHSLLPHSKLH